MVPRNESRGDQDQIKERIAALNDAALEQAIDDARRDIWGITGTPNDPDLASRYLGWLLLERDRRRRSRDRLRFSSGRLEEKRED